MPTIFEMLDTKDKEVAKERLQKLLDYSSTGDIAITVFLNLWHNRGFVVPVHGKQMTLEQQKQVLEWGVDVINQTIERRDQQMRELEDAEVSSEEESDEPDK